MRNLPLIAIALTLGAIATGAPARDGGVSLLSAADLDPQAVLPPPPAAGSTQAVAELAELHAMEQHRSAADIAAAKLDGETKNPTIFAEVLGPSFDLAKLPATKQLFDMVRATEKQMVDRGKDEFKRPRPWIADPALQSCARSDDPLSSYPSGHTSMAFSMAGVLARLVPDKANAIMARAARYGESRIVCEQHFRSDVTAGEALGLLIADRLMAKPAFRAAFDAAHRELATAGIARTA
jgi:hypothetical protein